MINVAVVVVGVLFISDIKVKKPQNPMIIMLVALVGIALAFMFAICYKDEIRRYHSPNLLILVSLFLFWLWYHHFIIKVLNTNELYRQKRKYHN